MTFSRKMAMLDRKRRTTAVAAVAALAVFYVSWPRYGSDVCVCRVSSVCTGGNGCTSSVSQRSRSACVEDGLEPLCFECDDDICGFWRFKEDENQTSVYQSTHIDTDRDLNSYGDRPWTPDKPLLIHNEELVEYLRQNVEEFGLADKIKTRTKVTWVTPSTKDDNGDWKWNVSYRSRDADSETENECTEEFDGVMICTGRHGGGGYIPPFPGLDSFEGTKIHSSHYKYPSKHNIDGNRVLVVGIGNSGIDIVTETCQVAKKTYLLARSGGWIFRLPHGEEAFSKNVMDRLRMTLTSRAPWWELSEFVEDRVLKRRQSILNKHGLEPQHRFMQQHLIVSGLSDPKHTLHDELEKGNITVKKGISRFTPKGVVFTDSEEEFPLDAVIFATGYRQAVDFVDPKVIDMRYEREGNDVPMYHCMFPIPRERGDKYNNICFINFVQSVTFMCAELQSRLFTAVLNKRVVLPPLSQQRRQMEDARNTLCAQYMDRQQLRIQYGLSIKFYDNMAKQLGCYPSLLKLLLERPTAFWHAWLTPWQGLHYRLVGEDRYEDAEQQIERLYESRFYSPMPDGTPRKGPRNRGGIMGTVIGLAEYATLAFVVLRCRLRGGNIGPNIEDKLQENLEYAKKDPVPHCLSLGKDSLDVKELKLQAKKS